MQRHLSLHFDGSCAPKNPGGRAGYGYILTEGPKIVNKDFGIIGEGKWTSNNLAELYALYRGLRAVLSLLLLSRERGLLLSVRGDSKLAINLMNKKFKPNREKLYYPAYVLADNAVRVLRRKFAVNITFDWVPRELNQEADSLSKNI